MIRPQADARRPHLRPRAPVVRALLHWIDSNALPWTLPLPPWCDARARRLRRLRQLARRRLRAHYVAYHGWPRTLTQSLVWPVMALLKAVRSLRSYPIAPGGGMAARLDAIALRWWLQVAHNLMIADQAYLLLHLPAYRRRPTAFITEHEHQALIFLANQQSQGIPGIHHKNPFARFCADHDLPTVCCRWRGRGDVVELATPLPPTDLFLKPAAGGEGEGAEILRRAPRPADGWLTQDGDILGAAALGPYIARRLGDQSWVVQDRAMNAPAWLPFTAGALATVRVVTVKCGPTDSPACLIALLRLPRQNAAVDNLSAGGLGTDIDLSSGRMQAARDWVDLHTHHDRHPETGGHIAGVILPEWPAIKALALRAHAAAGDWFTLGWDISLTEHGPCLIETNLKWSITPFVPIQDTDYTEVMAARFRSAPTPSDILTDNPGSRRAGMVAS